MSNPLATRKLERLQDSLLDGSNAMPPKLAQILRDNCYVDKLAPWFDAFPRDRFLLLDSDDLRGDVPVRQRILDDVHDFLDLPAHAYATEDLDLLGNFHLASNATVLPLLRRTVNCLPVLVDCEWRLEALLDAPPGAFDWCARARADLPDAGDVRLASSRPPMPRPSPMPTPKPRKKKRRSWWRGAGPDI